MFFKLKHTISFESKDEILIWIFRPDHVTLSFTIAERYCKNTLFTTTILHIFIKLCLYHQQDIAMLKNLEH